jgi:hypothetical protein
MPSKGNSRQGPRARREGEDWRRCTGGSRLSGNIVQGDLEAEEWKELSLDSVMADFVHMDAAVEVDTAKADAKATVKVVDSNDAPQSDQEA